MKGNREIHTWEKEEEKLRHKGSWRQRELETEKDRAKERASVAESALAKVCALCTL